MPVNHIELGDLPTSAVRVNCQQIGFERPAQLADPAAELARLCSAATPSQIGTTGPVAAAAANPGEQRPEYQLYTVLFGRDSLTVADLVWEQHPALARTTVASLAALAATTIDVAADAEPGRIPHEVRDPAADPIAATITAQHGWAWPYYGTVDATPLFISVAARVLARWPGDAHRPLLRRDGTVTTLIETVASAAAWTAGRVRRSPSQMIESWPAHPGSIGNQVWKDSPDSYHHTDGSLATPGTVASVEVAARTVDALRAAEQLAGRWPDERWPDRPGELADTVAGRVEDLWTGEWYALGFDRHPTTGAERRLEVVTSNGGWVLDSSVCDTHRGRDRARQVARRVMAGDLVCDAGVRTLAAGEARFWPGAYHNGSVWPFDTALIARGLARHGHHDEACELARRIVAVCETLRCYPELVAGVGEGIVVNDTVIDVTHADGFAHRLAQPPQQVQAWTVAAYLWATRHLRLAARLR